MKNYKKSKNQKIKGSLPNPSKLKKRQKIYTEHREYRKRGDKQIKKERRRWVTIVAQQWRMIK
jgi:hypothetical protein